MNASESGADLRWLLLSAPLLNPAHPRFAGRVVVFGAHERTLIEEWLRPIEADPAPLDRFLTPFFAANGPVRLGRYAERLLEYYLRHGPLHRLVAANVPIRRDASDRAKLDHTTLGEVDFLVECPRGRPEHWELAVKYFLHTGDGSAATTDDFIGPDAAEVFTRKIDKLIDRQLGNQPPAPFNDKAWQPRAFTRGWMFYRDAAPLCDVLAPDHPRGRWVRRIDADTLPDGDYVHVPRQSWMARRALLPFDPRIERRDAALARIDGMWQGPAPGGARRWPSAQLVARLVARREHNVDRMVEIERVFIVPR